MAKHDASNAGAVAESVKPIDELARIRGKRGIISIKIGGRVVRTIELPFEHMKNPLAVLRARKRKT